MPFMYLPGDGVIKIGVSKALERELRHDAESFEIFKGKEQNVDMNKFLNILIPNYYDRYISEVVKQSDSVRNVLSRYITDPGVLESAVSQLIENYKSDNDGTQKIDGRPFRFRPTKENEIFILNILNSIDQTAPSFSEEFRRILYSYSKKPSYERERIIYHDAAEKLMELCRKKVNIRFVYRDNPYYVHTVTPYKLLMGADGLYNYLLCQEYNEKTGKLMALSYRLSRILNIRETPVKQVLDETVRNHLEKMEECGPQYLINEDTETCVELTEEGRSNYRKIYQGRPLKYTADKPDDSGNARYYFSCSQDQLFLYFRRFNPGEASVIYPEKLKRRLVQFHERHLEAGRGKQSG